MNIAHKRPIAFKISENDLWYFFNSFNLMKVWLLDNYNNCLVLPSGYFVFTMFFQNT